MVTIKDIARRAGVSNATVSRALNEKSVVRAETRERIKKIAREMGYYPNALAQSLVTNKTKTIGLIVPDISNPFFAEISQSAEEISHQRGYSIFLCSVNQSEQKELSYLEILESKRVDGFILASVKDDGSTIKKFMQSGRALVLINTLFQEFDCHQVVIDNIYGGYLATSHLLKLGHRRIGFVGGLQDSKVTAYRFAGYKKALEEKGIAVDASLVNHGPLQWESGYERTLKLLKNSKNAPTAIFAGNDMVALGAMWAAEEAGLSVPEDLALVGFDDLAIANYPRISLTTVSQPKRKMGEEAINLIIDELSQGQSAEKKRIVLQPTLIVRRSCGAKRGA